MKVLFLVPHRMQPSDARYRALPLVELGRERGLDVSLKTVPRSRLRRYAFFSRLPRADVIVVHRELLSAFELQSVTRLCSRLVYDYSDAAWARTQTAGKAKAARRFARLCARADLCVADNRILAERAGTDSDKVVVVPTGLHTDRYTPGRGGNESGSVLVGWLGREGRAAELQDALATLADHAGAIQFSIVSDTPYAGPGQEFVFWSQHSEEREPEQLQAMDIGLCPSWPGESGRFRGGVDVTRYMACGVAVVASEAGPGAEIIDHGIDGFLVRDEADWARHVMRLAEDDALRAQVCEAARSKVLKKYDLQVVADQFWRLLGT